MLATTSRKLLTLTSKSKAGELFTELLLGCARTAKAFPHWTVTDRRCSMYRWAKSSIVASRTLPARSLRKAWSLDQSHLESLLPQVQRSNWNWGWHTWAVLLCPWRHLSGRVDRAARRGNRSLARTCTAAADRAMDTEYTRPGDWHRTVADWTLGMWMSNLIWHLSNLGGVSNHVSAIMCQQASHEQHAHT